MRALWADASLSVAAIAARMGLTKNSVLGRAHRLSLTGRSSPIVGRPVGRAIPLGGAEELALARARSNEVRRQRAAAAKIKPHVASQAIVLSKTTLCSWPIGEPRTPAFRYCDEPTVAGRSYCQAHCEQAYIKPSRRQVQSGELWVGKR